MALLVFLPAAAGAGIVATDLIFGPLCWSRRRDRFIATVQGQLGLRALGNRLRRSRRLFTLMADGLYMEQPFQRVGLDPFHHAGEQIEPFSFIFDEGVFLPVSTKSDAVSQMVHP